MPNIAFSEQDAVRWRYNCDDTIYTQEIKNVQERKLEKQSDRFKSFVSFQQHDLNAALIRVMQRGIRIDREKKALLDKQLTYLMSDVEAKLNYLIGESFNCRSTKQMKAVFKDLLEVKLKVDKKSRSESCSSAFMAQYLTEYPEYRALISLILEYRSIGVFLSTFVQAGLDERGRMVTNYGAAGTKTYRLSSRAVVRKSKTKGIPGIGANLANIPSKGKIKLKYALAEYDDGEEDSDITDEELESLEGLLELPNCKEMFIPDEGYTFWNADYSGADAMIVGWDAGCAWLKEFFTKPPVTSYGEPFKLYQYVASHYHQRELDIRAKDGKALVPEDTKIYKIFKQWCHGSHYGMKEEKAALQSGIPVKESKKLRNWYFGPTMCHEVLKWHDRIEKEINTRGYVENAFGARGWFLNYDSSTRLNQAIAWIPQSSIGVLTNTGLVNIDQQEDPENVQVLMQIHDALAGQHLSTDLSAPERIRKHMTITIPYDDPLVIPTDITTSEISYGHC